MIWTRADTGLVLERACVVIRARTMFYTDRTLRICSSCGSLIEPETAHGPLELKVNGRIVDGLE